MTCLRLNQNITMKILLFLLIIFSNQLVISPIALNVKYNAEHQHTLSANWESSIPEDQGMNSTYFELMDEEISESGHALHGLVITRNGYIIHETYPDWRYTEKTRHRIFSATKSVGSILIGIAIDMGFISSVDERVIDFFSDYTIANLDDRKKSMTLKL